MANQIQLMTAESLTTSPTTLSNLNTFSVINQSNDVLFISTNAGVTSISLTTGQTLMISSNVGFVLPPILMTGSNMNAQVIYS
tara:strand:+ start:925 stop:1173 length:249 start_codon:yes stop_codon:yes gene_type:complete